MKNFNQKTAVILFNLGGPDSLSSVEKFLFNLFSDKAIIDLPQPLRFLIAKLISKRRAKKVQKIYAQIGGKSPLLNTTLAQAYALEKELSFFGNFKVFVSMRYFHPFAAEVIKEVKKYEPDKVILLPLYPQFSSATSRSSLQDFIEKFDAKIPLKVVCCYPTQPEFIKSHAILIKQKIVQLYEQNLHKFRFLFSAHGLPQKLVNAGDPYVFQVTQTTEKIVENLAEIFSVQKNEIDFRICYQSKVGPLQWTSPSLDTALRCAILDKKISVIVPVAFVSDHLETLAELDIEYKNLALELGAKNYLRVPALNLEGHFIKALTEICKEANVGDESQVFSGVKNLRICPKEFKFCQNPNPCQA